MWLTLLCENAGMLQLAEKLRSERQGKAGQKGRSPGLDSQASPESSSSSSPLEVRVLMPCFPSHPIPPFHCFPLPAAGSEVTDKLEFSGHSQLPLAGWCTVWMPFICWPASWCHLVHVRPQDCWHVCSRVVGCKLAQHVAPLSSMISPVVSACGMGPAVLEMSSAGREQLAWQLFMPLLVNLTSQTASAG